MILLKTLQINNFLSHENTQITFKENQKLLIDGKSGSGKSSITEAIFWALYGKGRSDNRSLLRKGTKIGNVSLKLSIGEQETIITRSISSTGKNTLNITQNKGEKGQFLPIERTGLKDHQDWIEKTFLKASYELFTNSIAYPQENETSFVKSNATKRKDLLLEIVGADNFDEFYEKAKNLLYTNDSETNLEFLNHNNIEANIIEFKKNISEKDNHIKTYTEIEEKVKKLTSKEKELEEKLINISQITHKISDKKQVIKALKDVGQEIKIKINTIKTEIEDHNKIDINLLNENFLSLIPLEQEIVDIEKKLENSSIIQQNINSHLSDKPQVYDYQEEIASINKRLIPLLKEKGLCPAGDACPFVLPIKGQIDFLTSQIEEKEKKERDSLILIKEWERKFDLLPKPVDITELYNELKTKKDKQDILLKTKTIIEIWNELESKLSEKKQNIIKLEKDYNDNNEAILFAEKELSIAEKDFLTFDSNFLNSEISKIKIEKQSLVRPFENASYGIKLAENSSIALVKELERVEESNNKISKKIKERQELTLIKEAFSPRGIKAVIIDYLVPQLEERINNVLGQMSDFKIRLDTQKTTIDEEGIKEGLFITVINDIGEELPYESYSGGEKIKITISISEALASLMSGIGFRIMDENILSLDKESTESFVDVLIKLQEKFPQLLIISHLQEIKDLFENKIEIKKINGVSRII